MGYSRTNSFHSTTNSTLLRFCPASRTALGLSPGQNERAAVSGNMGALLMSAGRLTEALHVIEGIIQMANEGKIPKEQQVHA